MDGRPRAAPGIAAIEDHPRAMAGRRLMLFVVLLLVIGAMASATVPRERRAPAEPPPLPAPAQLSPEAGVVQARLPAHRHGGRARGGLSARSARTGLAASGGLRVVARDEAPGPLAPRAGLLVRRAAEVRDHPAGPAARGALARRRGGVVGGGRVGHERGEATRTQRRFAGC